MNEAKCHIHRRVTPVSYNCASPFPSLLRLTRSAADYFGWPVSTTHVLSSGVAGTMAANHSGLQWGTVRNLLMAWVLTLPVAMTLSGFLFWTFLNLF